MGPAGIWERCYGVVPLFRFTGSNRPSVVHVRRSIDIDFPENVSYPLRQRLMVHGAVADRTLPAPGVAAEEDGTLIAYSGAKAVASRRRAGKSTHRKKRTQPFTLLSRPMPQLAADLRLGTKQRPLSDCCVFSFNSFPLCPIVGVARHTVHHSTLLLWPPAQCRKSERPKQSGTPEPPCRSPLHADIVVAPDCTCGDQGFPVTYSANCALRSSPNDFEKHIQNNKEIAKTKPLFFPHVRVHLPELPPGFLFP